MSSPIALEQLLAERDDLWRGRHRRPEPSISTGRAALDRQLPGGGWPRGKLIELLPQRLGAGELDLLLPCLAELTRHAQRVLFIAPPLIPCPQSLHQNGLDLTRLLIVREQAHAFWTAEQCLKSGLCGAVVAWPGRADVNERAVRRLQLAAENGEAPLFLCYPPGCSPPASLAALRLAILDGGVLEILRSRQAESGDTIRLQASNVVSLATRSAR
ncbi:MAG: translesion DNA synthesis-associated protein ImuA [Wenzhouxiangellaceae bacterium]|nr:translesion DNA synthesis-associated protein ImuA [Wenzhouxiangellaceae bacterium]